MRYNPPPNWPKPPKGWVPYPDWSPDPSWPPPPPGWQLWVDDEESPDGRSAPSALGRLRHAGDDEEYFGDENAWADDSGPAPADEDLASLDGGTPPQQTEVAPAELSASHLGLIATIKWDDEHTYDIGRIVAVTADATTIKVKLAGIEALVSFARQPDPDREDNPRIFV